MYVVICDVFCPYILLHIDCKYMYMYVHVCFCIPSTCLSREVVLGIVYLSIFLYNLYVQDVKMRVYFQFSMYGIKRNFAANEQTTRAVDVYMYM